MGFLGRGEEGELCVDFVEGVVEEVGNGGRWRRSEGFEEVLQRNDDHQYWLRVPTEGVVEY